jgi:hypothetical protein
MGEREKPETGKGPGSGARPTKEGPRPSLGDLVDRAVKWLADRLVPAPEPVLVPVPIPIRRPPPRRRY